MIFFLEKNRTSTNSLSLLWPLSSVPKVAVVERFDCTLHFLKKKGNIQNSQNLEVIVLCNHLVGIYYIRRNWSTKKKENFLIGSLRGWTTHKLILANCFFNSLKKINSFCHVEIY